MFAFNPFCSDWAWREHDNRYAGDGNFRANQIS
jgi:hypothetical protein